MRKNMILAAAVILALAAPTAAYAQGWELGTGDKASSWKYVNDDGSLKTGWNVIDGNQDGTAEWYWFDTDGWLLVSGTTPDGYTVNENGAWVNDGAVVTVKTEAAKTDTAASSETSANTETAANTGAAAGTDSAKASNTFEQMPRGKYNLYSNVFNGTTQKISMNVLYTSYYEIVSVSDSSITLMYTLIDTYGMTAQLYKTFDKKGDKFLSENNEVIEWDTETQGFYIGEPDYSKGNMYFYEAEKP